MNVTLRPMTATDTLKAATLLDEIMRADPGYISHGELQMGIAVDMRTVAPRAREIVAGELLERLQAGDTAMIVALLGDEIVGFISAREEEQFGTRYGVVADLGVALRCRRCGIGRLLLDQALAMFQAAGIPRVFLESGLDNESAHSFFNHFGFHPVSKVFVREMNQ